MAERGDTLERINWQPRQLVGPDTQPKLTTLEGNVETALRGHRHGHIIRTEGTEKIYEAAPLDTSLITVDDPLNPDNLTLAQHLADDTLHGTEAAELPPLKIMRATIPLDSPVDTIADYEEGNVTESWQQSAVPSLSFVRPIADALSNNYYEGGVQLNNCFSLAFTAAHQRFGVPFAFDPAPPKVGRIWQHGFYQLYSNAIFETAPMPRVVGFDYILFPYRTFYNLFQSSIASKNYTYDRTVVKRYTTQAFPDSYRVSPGSLRMFWQLRHALSFTMGNHTGPLEIYWPSGSPWNANGVPSYVSEGEVYTVPQEAQDDRPGVIGANYVGIDDYKIKPSLVPDWSTFENANNPWVSQFQITNANVWSVFRQQYAYTSDPYPGTWAYKFFDWMLPLSQQDNFSFRMLFSQPNDNQLRIYPLSMCGFMIILPYGYLPLYSSTNPPFYGNDIGRYWALANLRMAPANAKIFWENPGGGVDYLVPRLYEDSPSESKQYGYPYPKDINADVMILGPGS